MRTSTQRKKMRTPLPPILSFATVSSSSLPLASQYLINNIQEVGRLDGLRDIGISA